MSAQPLKLTGAPSHGLGVGTLGGAIRLAALRMWRGRKLRVALIATVVVLAIPITLGVLRLLGAAGAIEPSEWFTPPEPAALVEGTYEAYYSLLVYLFPLLFATGLVSEEVTGRTWHFLAVSSGGRVTAILGGLFVSALGGIALAAVGMLLIHLLAYADDPTALIEELPKSLRAIGAAALLIAVYSVFGLFWSVATPRIARMMTIMHFGLGEMVLGSAPTAARFGAMRDHARRLGDMPFAGLEWMVPEIEPWVSAVVLGSMIVVATAATLLLLRNTELSGNQ